MYKFVNGPEDEVEHDDYVPPDWPGGNPNTYEDHDEVATEAERILND